MARNILILCFILFKCNLNAQEVVQVKEFNAPEAHQGIAVNKNSMFIISNQEIVKRNKSSGQKIRTFESSDLIHLNSGFISKRKLYCAHSNYPNIPMTSSIEILDTNTLEHIGNHSFGIEYGSCTWMVVYKDSYYVMFANYTKEGDGQKYNNVSWSQLVKFDKNWHKTEAWTLPKKLVAHLAPFSISGGVISMTGKILLTHHDHKEIYVMVFPKIGSELIWESTIPVPFPGQAISLDPTDKNVIWGINRKEKKVIRNELTFIP